MTILRVAIASIAVSLALAADPTVTSGSNPAHVQFAGDADPASTSAPLPRSTEVPTTSLLLTSVSSSDSDAQPLDGLDDGSDMPASLKLQTNRKKTSLTASSGSADPLKLVTLNSVAPPTGKLPVGATTSGVDVTLTAAPLIISAPTTLLLHNARTTKPDDQRYEVPAPRAIQTDTAASIVLDAPLQQVAPKANLVTTAYAIATTPARTPDASMVQTPAPQVYPSAAPPQYTGTAPAQTAPKDLPHVAIVQSPTAAPVTSSLPIAITPSSTDSSTDSSTHAPQTATVPPTVPTDMDTPPTQTSQTTQNPQTTAPHDPNATAPPSTGAPLHGSNSTAVPSTNTTQPAATPTPTPHVNDIQPAPTSSTSGSSAFAGSSAGSSSAQSGSASGETGDKSAAGSGSKMSASKTKSGASRTAAAASEVACAIALVAGLALAVAFA